MAWALTVDEVIAHLQSVRGVVGGDTPVCLVPTRAVGDFVDGVGKGEVEFAFAEGGGGRTVVVLCASGESRSTNRAWFGNGVETCDCVNCTSFRAERDELRKMTIPGIVGGEMWDVKKFTANIVGLRYKFPCLK